MSKANMKKQFVICVGAKATVAQDQAFVQYLKGAQLRYWHWIKGVWLVVDPDGRFSAAGFRNKLKECYPTVRTLVLEEQPSDGNTWAGFGPNVEGNNMFQWIKDSWNKPGN